MVAAARARGRPHTRPLGRRRAKGGDAIALGAAGGGEGEARAVGLLEGVTAKPHQLAEGVASDVAAARRAGGPRDGDELARAAVVQPAAPAPAP